MMNSRAVSAEIIAAILGKSGNLDQKLASIKQEKAFVQTLCYGVCRYYFQLNCIANQLLQKPFKRKDNDILALILIGLYQFLYLDTKEHAAINECVEAAKQLNKSWASGLINAVLRNFQRKRTELITKIEGDPSSKYAHPSWLIKKIKSAWPNQWQAILGTNNQQPPMTLRINRQKISCNDYLKKLQEQNILATSCQYSPEGIVLTAAQTIKTLPGFTEGEFSVQDEAAQLAASLLDLEPRQTILDACAAPGGKTCHLLETQPNINLLALDNSQKRCEKMNENLQRLQLQANVKCADILDVKRWRDNELFDRILLDAPCSATGVIRRHPDIKLLRSEKDISALATVQREMLKALWPLLKNGGLLLYVTCSILPEENDHVIKHFLQQHSDAENKKIQAKWGRITEYGRQILPSNMDGFYYAKLLKT